MKNIDSPTKRNLSKNNIEFKFYKDFYIEKELKHYRAYYPKTETWVDLEYESLFEAKKHNPILKRFREVEV